MEGYQKQYTAHKDMRKLEWKKSLGLVQLELEFQDGRKLELSVVPIHAAIISCFSSPEGGMADEILTTTRSWTSLELAEKVGVSVEVLRKRVSFWKTQNVLRETQKDVFEVIEVLLDNETDSHHHSHKKGRSGLGEGDGEAEEEDEDEEDDVDEEEEQVEGGSGSKKDKKKQRQKQKGSGSGESEELWATCEKFVVAMLTNLGVLQLERIQGMLTQFVESYNQTIHQLKSHLNQMVNEDRLELIQSNSSSNNTNNPSYSLKK
jgi:uncharacterized spore protein YtfJ